jgi:hypothetical protein
MSKANINGILILGMHRKSVLLYRVVLVRDVLTSGCGLIVGLRLGGTVLIRYCDFIVRRTGSSSLT